MVVASGDELDEARGRSQGQDRAVQRALHQLRRDRRLSLRRRPHGGAARRRRGAGARGRPHRPAHAAHRRHELRRRCGREDPDRGHPRRRHPAHSAPRQPRHQGAPAPQDGSALRTRRRVVQRRRRDSRQREARRDRPRRLPLRLVGSRHRRVGRWRGMHRGVGGGAADEEAEHPPEAHRARGAVHQRRERHARRQRLSRSARQGGGESHHGVRVRLRRVRAGAPGLHRLRGRAARSSPTSARCSRRSACRTSAPAAVAPTSARSRRSARCR